MAANTNVLAYASFQTQFRVSALPRAQLQRIYVICETWVFNTESESESQSESQSESDPTPLPLILTLTLTLYP